MLGQLFVADKYDPQTGEPTEWIDCFEQWGVGLEYGAFDALMGFRPNKEPVVNKNVTSQGAYYVTGAGLVDERTVNIPFHIVARDFPDFLIKRAGFYNYLKSGLVWFRIEKPLQAIYKMYYISCNQYTQFNSGVAQFMLSMYETNGFADDDNAKFEPIPMTQDMKDYLAEMLELFGCIATDEEVKAIIDNYDYSQIQD